MRVMVTGAAGFLGVALTKYLLQIGQLTLPSGAVQPISELLLVDRQIVNLPVHATVAVRAQQGDLSDPAFATSLAAQGYDTIFHLAASLTLAAEQDPVQAYQINVASVRHLIEGAARPPRFVFASSIAVFGGVLPDVVDDLMRAEPDTTYGTHKAMVELMLANYSRMGYADGRALRLPVVLIRQGAANPTVSDRVAAIARETLAGNDTVCGLAPDTRIPVVSANAVARALIQLHEVPVASLPHARAMNLPALTVSVEEMIQSVRRCANGRKLGELHYHPDVTLQRIVDSWPKVFISNDATALGLHADADFDTIIEQYLDHGAALRR